MSSFIKIATVMVLGTLIGCAAPKKQLEEEKQALKKELSALLAQTRKEQSADKHQFRPESNTLRSNQTKPMAKRSNLTCTSNAKTALESKPPKVSLSFLEADLRDALVEISVMTGIPIVMDDMVEGLVSANFNDVPLPRALDILLAASDLSYRFYSDYILVGQAAPDSSSFANLAITCRYKPYHMLPIDLAASLAPYFQQFVRVPEHADYLTITAPVKLQNSIQERLRTFDQAPDQVLLEMSIVEVSREALDVMGISWSRMGKDPNTQMIRRMGSAEWSGLAPMQDMNLADAFTIGMLPHRTLADSIQFLQKHGDANIKAMPSIVSLDGREALFSTTHTVLVPETIDSFKAKEMVYGVEMNVVPRIANDGQVTLNIVNASVSDLTLNELGQQHLISHKISNTVSIRDGDYLVLGGLLQKKVRAKGEGLPGLKDHKTLGSLFGSNEAEYQETEVLIMIRPQILQNNNYSG